MGLADRADAPTRAALRRRAPARGGRAGAGQRARLLLADEPTGALDSATSELVLDLLFGLRDRLGMTMILVSYDAAIGARADRTVTIADGVLRDGDPAPKEPVPASSAPVDSVAVRGIERAATHSPDRRLRWSRSSCQPAPPPARTLLTAAGIAVGVATIVALLSFTQGLRESAAGFVHLGGSELGVFQANVSDPTASLLPEATVERLKERPQVADATPLLLIVEAVKQDPAAMLFGARPDGFFARQLVIVRGARPANGTREALLGDRLAAQLKAGPGTTLATPRPSIPSRRHLPLRHPLRGLGRRLSTSPRPSAGAARQARRPT